MGLFKILGGAALGVAAIAALPIAGAVGTVALAGGAAAAAAGAVAGAVADKYDDTEERAENRGRASAAAEYDKKMEKLLSHFNDVEKKLGERGKYFEGILAMTAVGIACANCDGNIAKEEKEEINDFITGVAGDKLPSDIKDKIKQMWTNPPNVKTAFKLAKNLELDSLELFSEIIEITIYADDKVHPKELVFKQAWNKLAAA